MRKKLVVLSIVGLMSMGSITYAADKIVTPNIEQSNICLEEARTFNRKNDSASAEKKLNEAIKLNNKNADAYYELGRIELDKNNNDKAISYFNKAIQIAPDKEEYYYARGLAEGFKFQLKLLIDDMKKVIEINPENGDAYAVLSAPYMRFGHPEQALEFMNKAIQYNKTTSLDREYQLRAEIKLQLRDFDGAIADYNKAIIETKKGNDPLKAQKIEFLKRKVFETQEAKKVF